MKKFSSSIGTPPDRAAKRESRPEKEIGDITQAQKGSVYLGRGRWTTDFRGLFLGKAGNRADARQQKFLMLRSGGGGREQGAATWELTSRPKRRK